MTCSRYVTFNDSYETDNTHAMVTLCKRALRSRKVRNMLLYDRDTELPPTTSSNFHSISTDFSLKIARASSAMDSKPLVAKANIVGPAPDKHIPNRPGWVDGVIDDVTSGRPGI